MGFPWLFSGRTQEDVSVQRRVEFCVQAVQAAMQSSPSDTGHQVLVQTVNDKVFRLLDVLDREGASHDLSTIQKGMALVSLDGVDTNIAARFRKLNALLASKKYRMAS